MSTVENALADCAAGDRAALRWLYEREAPAMLGVAVRMLKRRALAEEIVQDTFIAIWNGAASFDPARGAGRAWIYTILRNRSLNLLRGEARVELSAPDTDLATDEASPEDVVMRLSDQSALRRCLQTLDEARRRLIVLAYTDGLSHSQIARRLDEPLGSVKSRIRRALLSLKACLQ